jgi:AraC-like DNA-binding protein
MNAIQDIWFISQQVLGEQRQPTLEELRRIEEALHALQANQEIEVRLLPSPSLAEKQWLDRFFNLLALHHHDAGLSLTQICRALAMSRANLNRRVKTLTGEAVMEHLRRIRLEFAATKLLDEDAPIYAIAYECGFSDPNYFCRAFTKTYRQSPTRYRQSARNLGQKSRILSQ